jgi:hypothetical protein
LGDNFYWFWFCCSCRAYDYKSNKGVTMETMYEIFLRLVYLVGIGVIYLDG